MTLSIRPTEIPDVLEIASPILGDARGSFTELFNSDRWRTAGFTASFPQDNLSGSSRGTLRGLHYQIEPHGQGKLVRCLRGSVFDVSVDIRRGSPYFGKWVGRTLTGTDGVALWVPAGFAHGFLALEDDTMFLYKCTSCYTPAAERSIVWNDPAIGIAWPSTPLYLSPKDAGAPTLDAAEYNFEYRASARV